MWEKPSPYWKIIRQMIWPTTNQMLREMSIATGAKKVQIIDWLVRGAYDEFNAQETKGDLFDGYLPTREESTREFNAENSRMVREANSRELDEIFGEAR